MEKSTRASKHVFGIRISRSISVRKRGATRSSFRSLYEAVVCSYYQTILYFDHLEFCTLVILQQIPVPPSSCRTLTIGSATATDMVEPTPPFANPALRRSCWGRTVVAAVAAATCRGARAQGEPIKSSGAVTVVTNILHRIILTAVLQLTFHFTGAAQ